MCVRMIAFYIKEVDIRQLLNVFKIRIQRKVVNIIIKE